MCISSKAKSRFFAACLLCIPLSSCNAFWMMGLEAQRLTKRTDTLPNTATSLENCQLNQQCDRTFSLQLNWPTSPSVFIDLGTLPPGLSFSVTPIPEKNADYTINIQGIPTEAGDYSFQLGLECCMTMSGPMNKARTEPIMLTITP